MAGGARPARLGAPLGVAAGAADSRPQAGQRRRLPVEPRHQRRPRLLCAPLVADLALCGAWGRRVLRGPVRASAGVHGWRQDLLCVRRVRHLPGSASHTISCRAMLCYAVRCDAMRCYAMPCHAYMPCHRQLISAAIFDAIEGWSVTRSNLACRSAASRADVVTGTLPTACTIASSPRPPSAWATSRQSRRRGAGA